jgi:hypothetical protein
MHVTGGPTDKFQRQQIYQSYDGHTHHRISTPVRWTMLVTDRPIDEFWRPFDLSCLWRTDRPMNFDACSIFDDCDGHTNRWISTTVWSTILTLTFNLILSSCQFFTASIIRVINGVSCAILNCAIIRGMIIRSVIVCEEKSVAQSYSKRPNRSIKDVCW